MPELPEVETTCRGIEPLISNTTIVHVVVRNHSLRWPVPGDISDILADQKILRVTRRAKYILFNLTKGTLIIHLGMSGSLRILDKNIPPAKHDHVDIVLSNSQTIRFNDARRFGSIHWTTESINQHRLLAHLGIEPLTAEFDANFLLEAIKGKKTNIKQTLMNHNIVVGIGNIYACETLFLAKISPTREASSINALEATKIVSFSKATLQQAILNGGTTLKDFKKADGTPGYFQNELMVYGRHGEKCYNCDSSIAKITQNQRSTFYCESCQV
tara:strand:- start:6700 stop:7515 length:816 start_codon:yes stop_codon:yes gene_type:complete